MTGGPLMVDSTSAEEIPETASIVAGYTDGFYAWSDADWARFPNAQKVTITVKGAAGARVADVEFGDLSPASGAAWAAAEYQQRRRPCLYCNKSTKPDLVAALAGYGLAFGREVDWWAADPTGALHLLPGTVATQYAWNSLGQTPGWGNVDLSTTLAPWPASMEPMPPPSSKPPFVAIVADEATPGYYLLASDGGVFAMGGAQFFGSLGGQVLSAPIISMTVVPKGYFLMGTDGAVYAFGAARYAGGGN